MFGKDLVKLKGNCHCFFDKQEVINISGFKGCGVLSCPECGKVWQRDVNAALNMKTISKAVWSGQGRPDIFKPKKNTTNLSER
ncbi:uncharacterized protein BX663DRAFT_510162, partial [Cokeromyces recurvatus]|uniref:uncharacterized protein n=1 Tax=Cokeromyces recurvatus TaxID=90255 RepID=UPI00221EFC9D